MNMLKNKNKGFTIIEILVVVTIIAIIAVIVLFSVSAIRQKAKDAAAEDNFHQIAIAATKQVSETGSWAAGVSNPGDFPSFVPNYYSQNGYSATYYCADCAYYWQNYMSNTCIVLDIVDTANSNALKKRRCVISDSCPACPADISEAQNYGINQTVETAFADIGLAAQQFYDNNGYWPSDVNPGEAPAFYPGEWDASYYCAGCMYDYENWTYSCPNPCVFIDIRDQNSNIVQWAPIATSGCVGEPPSEGMCQ